MDETEARYNRIKDLRPEDIVEWAKKIKEENESSYLNPTYMEVVLARAIYKAIQLSGDPFED